MSLLSNSNSKSKRKYMQDKEEHRANKRIIGEKLESSPEVKERFYQPPYYCGKG